MTDHMKAIAAAGTASTHAPITIPAAKVTGKPRTTTTSGTGSPSVALQAAQQLNRKRHLY